ncbi:MAG: cell filamentation protein Fic [Sulfuricurvum sp. GWF2_44_89]|uniref:virulence RhuM family protein n=1 Tax=unclassified Sulfuricurvum TaxID=2632390 RepID=UPI0008B62741|nr:MULTISPECIES: virulence RhuM family protein [unclassified Sulfuricurvum]OHD79410.1 MAG: cell filamentation protein Fic [Sulfuricurvum sp. GWF2_44_89]OHD91241.1 MAG: cell filamentation protein Fic [Sulfuricurvum sp. RIFOXYD12_FULL_44_77]OHD92940.1 MAG: cell filamentation protein Fic [Sulfuricurvum sp. RIFOXYD2_FULL_44_160]
MKDLTTSNILIYQTEDGKTKIETRLENETVWLTQDQMAELFQRDRTVITKHLRNIFNESELDEKSNVQNLHFAHSDKPIKYYNLDVIISVGYRVKSLQGTKFRQWATARLKEYIVKGFVMNDELLKNTGGGNYFEELLSRIRDIRSSEKVFWRKVLDIYATSIDYDPKAEQSILFFQTVQNKIHWAVHGNTAAEIVYQRADGSKLNMGLTHFIGSRPTKSEAEIAKNYLSVEELELLNRIVTAYIEVAEIQAINKTPMYMSDWIMRLDDFLKMTGKNILEHAGKISHQIAMEKAHSEYEKYKEMTKDELSKVEKDFIDYIDQTAIMVKKGKK